MIQISIYLPVPFLFYISLYLKEDGQKVRFFYLERKVNFELLQISYSYNVKTTVVFPRNVGNI